MAGGAIILGNALLVATAVAGVALSPVEGRPVAVMGWPWAAEGEALRAVASASGAVLATTALGVLAVSSEPGFVARLHRSGAVLVVDARILAACRSS